MKIKATIIPRNKFKFGTVISETNDNVTDKVNENNIILVTHFLLTNSFFTFSFLLVCTFKFSNSFSIYFLL